MEYSIDFSPLIAKPALIAAFMLAIVIGLVSIAFKMRGSWIRLIALIMLAVALAGPSLVQENRERLKTVVALVLDRSESQSIAQRQTQTEEAKKTLLNRLGALDDFEVKIVDIDPQLQNNQQDVATALISELQAALVDFPPARVGGAILVTDGQIHDVPTDENLSLLGGNYPIHSLITGLETEIDRRVVIENAPRFGIVGESQKIVYKVEDSGATASEASELFVEIYLNGTLISQEFVQTGQLNEFYFEVPNSGKSILELVAEPLNGELTQINNTAIIELDGIRENLRVLLVSGEPHAGERTWRRLLKSDASVDLVHFTILRPSEKQDGTPIDELSLIAFPTRELFVEKIEEFDLIIFDRYQRRGVLPGLYFDYMADYVRNGGAILLATGPEFAGLRSIASTALIDVLPAIPNGEVDSKPYRATVTPQGQRHPVTRGLKGANQPEGTPSWGRWFRRIGSGPVQGDTLLSDGNSQPVLALRHVEDGRVGLFLSDHPWLWARDFDGGGPHAQLLRRVVHWLMKEPELQEEALTGNMRGPQLVIERQTMEDAADDLVINTPNGESQTVQLAKKADGLWEYIIEKPQLGLYQFSSGNLRALAHAGPQNSREFGNVVSTVEIVEPLANASGGDVRRLALDNNPENVSIPRIVPIRQGTRAFGSGWIGLERTNETRLISLSRTPLFSGFLGLGLVLLVLTSMWHREGN